MHIPEFGIFDNTFLNAGVSNPTSFENDLESLKSESMFGFVMNSLTHLEPASPILFDVA